MNKKSFGQFVEEYRNELGLTQEQFAENIGTNARTVGKIESGIKVSEKMISKFAHYMGGTVTFLISFDKNSE